MKANEALPKLDLSLKPNHQIPPQMPNYLEFKKWSQFHQCFLHAFFVRKCLFVAKTYLEKSTLVQKTRAKKMLMKLTQSGKNRDVLERSWKGKKKITKREKIIQ